MIWNFTTWINGISISISTSIFKWFDSLSLWEWTWNYIYSHMASILIEIPGISWKLYKHLDSSKENYPKLPQGKFNYSLPAIKVNDNSIWSVQFRHLYTPLAKQTKPFVDATQLYRSNSHFCLCQNFIISTFQRKNKLTHRIDSFIYNFCMDQNLPSLNACAIQSS